MEVLRDRRQHEDQDEKIEGVQGPPEKARQQGVNRIGGGRRFARVRRASGYGFVSHRSLCNSRCARAAKQSGAYTPRSAKASSREPYEPAFRLSLARSGVINEMRSVRQSIARFPRLKLTPAGSRLRLQEGRLC